MSLLTFQLQSGAFRETIIVDGPEICMKDLREKANNFINQKVKTQKIFEKIDSLKNAKIIA